MNKKTQEVLFSSKSQEWETPEALFDKLDKVFKFTLDPCATSENAKCKKFYTKEDDGLSKDWCGHKVFVNPPYGREIHKWVKKSFEESCKKNTVVVMLIPARTDTKYWHEYCMKASYIYFIKGRLHFKNKATKDCADKTKTNPAPFPSAVIVFMKPITPWVGSIESK